MGKATKFAKITLVLLNSILVVCGVLMVVAGGIIGFGTDWLTEQLQKKDASYSYEHFVDKIPSERVADLLKGSASEQIGIAMLIIGCLTLVVSLLGCFGACKESKGMLVVYVAAVTLVLVVEVAMFIAFWALRPKFFQALKPQLSASLDKYSSNKADQQFWDAVHQLFRCCGVQNFTDFSPNIPQSCCNATGACLSSNVTYTQGCLSQLETMLDNSKVVVLAVSCSVMVLQLLLLIAAGLLINSANKVGPEE